MRRLAGQEKPKFWYTPKPVGSDKSRRAVRLPASDHAPAYNQLPQAVLPALRERKGHLLLTGSAAGRRHLKGSVYGATKWFVQGYAGNIAEEMADWGGRVTLLTPGLVDTPFFSTPKPGAIRPEDVAAAALFALEAAPTAVMGEIHIRPAP